MRRNTKSCFHHINCLQIRGFPTIKFFPAGSKDKVVDYRGERTVDAFAEFINANSGLKKEEKKDEL
jgi:hypothetical protein